MDPRVKTTPTALDQQFTLSMRLVPVINRLFDLGATNDRARSLHQRLLQVYNAIQGADVAPSSPLVRQADELLKEAESVGRSDAALEGK
jgi:hypothetical protein